MKDSYRTTKPCIDKEMPIYGSRVHGGIEEGPNLISERSPYLHCVVVSYSSALGNAECIISQSPTTREYLDIMDPAK